MAGTVLVLSLFGLIASFASAIVVDHRGPVHLVVGLIILVMGLNLGGWLPLTLPRLPELPASGGPFLVGMGFALVSSPVPVRCCSRCLPQPPSRVPPRCPC